MSTSYKNQSAILKKLGISALNEMQIEAQQAIHSKNEVVLLSPTGTGKTLAFLLPIMATIDPNLEAVQAVILTPSRELAIQIETVARDMGTGIKINVVYGGRHVSKDKLELKRQPGLLIGTPGRIADHLRRRTINTEHITTLILDEYDKSLEIGFEEEMEEILQLLPNVEKKILTSATEEVLIPSFVEINNPTKVNFLGDGVKQLEVKRIISPDKDKLPTLVKALCNFGSTPGIVFCNFKDSIQRVSDFLHEKGISHGCFYGGMEQKDRERALIKFRNGTHQLLLATDLAARGIDVPEIKFIIHYHLPQRSQEFTHRNGRTARMNSDGTAYILQWENEILPEFIEEVAIEALNDADIPEKSTWETLFISGGRKDKISKGDIAGLFIKKGKLQANQLGMIELKSDCAFVAVSKKKSNQLIQLIDGSKLKNKKVRISII